VLKKHPENYSVCAGYVSFSSPSTTGFSGLGKKKVLLIIDGLSRESGGTGQHPNLWRTSCSGWRKFERPRLNTSTCLRENPTFILALGLAIALQIWGIEKRPRTLSNGGCIWRRRRVEIWHCSHVFRLYYLSKKHWLESDKAFEEAMNEAPEYYGNYCGIAKAQSELAKLHEAKQSLERALNVPGLRSPGKEEIEGCWLTSLSESLGRVDSRVTRVGA